ncbi:hydrophobin [Infundibulicybe gibba]|nr:hydrophobin [Infundibulicybe gibba]
MFSKAILLVAASFALLAAANPVPDNTNSCNTENMYCCDSVQSTDTEAAKYAASLVNLDLTTVTGQVGITCSPTTVIGVGSGSSCSQQPTCCTGNNINGIIAVGCSPINSNL